MTLKVSTATETVWAVAFLPWRQQGFLLQSVRRSAPHSKSKRWEGIYIAFYIYYHRGCVHISERTPSTWLSWMNCYRKLG